MATIETNLNQSPYFDDFNEGKNFHRVLFRPGYAVQARELTQLQTILQNQIERFGDEVLDNGTVISGCDIELQNWQYVKLNDRSNNHLILLNEFFDGEQVANLDIVGQTSGVTAKLVFATEGSESAAPDYLTAFVSYTNSGTDNQTTTFADGENLILRNSTSSNFVLTADVISSSGTGTGLGVVSTEGVVYHKGHFIKSYDQLGVVDKYSITPTTTVGFETNESIVDSNEDSSLLDNASGATNFTAPGAARLKISTKVTSRDLSDANTSGFMVLADIQEGRVTRDYLDTKYGELEDELARRTYEESGNYALEPFSVNVREHLRSGTNGGTYGTVGSTEVGDNNKLVVEVEPSSGYINGYRTQLTDTVRKTIEKSLATDTIEDVNVGQVVGSYIVCDSVIGSFSSQQLQEVKIYSQQQNATVNTASVQGSLVGTAKVRGFEYHATGKYRIYLFDIKMNAGNSFQSDAKSLYIANSMGSGEHSFADLILTGGDARLVDTNLQSLVFPLQSSGVKQLADESYIYREEHAVALNASGQVTINLEAAPQGGTHAFNDTGSPSLSSTDKKNVIIVLKDAANSYSAGHVWDWDVGGTISADSSSMTINLPLTSSVNATVFYNVKRSSSSPMAKTINKSQYVHINTQTHPNGAIGPWDLGVADAFAIEGVYLSTDGQISNAGEDIVTNFKLDRGQRDAFYSGARLIKNADSTVDTTNKHLLVKFSYFTTVRGSDSTKGVGYYSLESYPVDDANPGAATSITIQEIPKYTTNVGAEYDLRDSIDFRPIKANTAEPRTTGTATTNPAAPTAFDITVQGSVADSSYFPVPDENFSADVTRYLPRADLVSIRNNGDIRIITGASEDNPSLPPEDPNSMTLACIYIPPYPSLSSTSATIYGRPRYEVIVERKDNKRLTMADLRVLENQVNINSQLISLNTKEIRALQRSVLTDDDPLQVAEPPKDSVNVDPSPDTTVENTLRSSNLPFTRDPLRVIPTLEDVELKLQGNPSHCVVSNTVITLVPAETNELISQPYATGPRVVTEKRISKAKLYNGQMETDHPVCFIEQTVDTVITSTSSSTAPTTITPSKYTVIKNTYGGGGYGFNFGPFNWFWN